MNKKLPKLKVKGLGWDAAKETCDFDQAKFFPYQRDLVIVVEQNVVRSYDDLIKLASQDPYKDKEFLEVQFLPVIVGG